MPNGIIQPEFQERLAYMGHWLHTYGASIYDTKGGYIPPQSWGCITQKGDTMFVHVLDGNATTITLDNFPYKKILRSYLLKDNSNVKAQLQNNTLTVSLIPANDEEPDEVIVLVCK